MADFKIEGLDAVYEGLDKIVDKDALRRSLAKACALVERSAKQKAPKGNGELRRSIKSRVEDIGEYTVGTVYTPLEYAPYVEFGTGLFAEEGGRQDVPWHYQDEKGEWHSTSGMKPSPYLRPALHDNRVEISRIIKEGVLND